MSDQENKQQGAESVEENTETVKTESAETSVPESGATPPAEEKNAEGRDGKEKGHRRELQKAKEEIEKLKAEAEDFKRKWYSVTAEYDNYRRGGFEKIYRGKERRRLFAVCDRRQSGARPRRLRGRKDPSGRGNGA